MKRAYKDGTPKPICKIVERGQECGRPVRARGWCTNHWGRWSRTGDPLGTRFRDDPVHPSRRAAQAHRAAGEPMCDLCEAATAHGTIAGFDWGCRCTDCRKAKNAPKRAWEAANPEKMAAARNSWSAANRDKIIAHGRAKMLEEPEKVHLCAARTRARKHSVPFDLTAGYLRELIAASDACPICGVTYERAESSGCTQASRTLDRNIPELGYVIGNVSFMCAADNTRKGRRTLAEYLAWLGGGEPQ